MAKRKSGIKRTKAELTTANAAAATADAMEERVMAFAEQLGRMAGTIQVRAEGLVDRGKLSKQIASVRDGAAHLLQQLAASAAAATRKKPAPATTRGGKKGRSGGLVDAPGKKHRKPRPSDPAARTARTQAAKLPPAKTMIASRRRARG